MVTITVRRRPRGTLPHVRPTAEQLQYDYYTATAEEYYKGWMDDLGAHHQALTLISALIDGFGYRSVLDIGAGTGRGTKHLLETHPNVDVRGVEPVRAMIDQAEDVGGVPRGCIVEGRGQTLPFENDSFDVVCEFGVLHHVRDPEAIVTEMMRVARRAVFLSDANRFAVGRRLAQAARYGIYRSGLWPVFNWLRTGGRGYREVEGDGIVYSYSVYDSLPVIERWADRIFMIPTDPCRVGWFHPLFGSVNVLVCALRDGSPAPLSRAPQSLA
jgi:SAM-dependent methyltransferase